MLIAVPYGGHPSRVVSPVPSVVHVAIKSKYSQLTNYTKHVTLSAKAWKILSRQLPETGFGRPSSPSTALVHRKCGGRMALVKR